MKFQLNLFILVWTSVLVHLNSCDDSGSNTLDKSMVDSPLEPQSSINQKIVLSRSKKSGSTKADKIKAKKSSRKAQLGSSYDIKDYPYLGVTYTIKNSPYAKTILRPYIEPDNASPAVTVSANIITAVPVSVEKGDRKKLDKDNLRKLRQNAVEEPKATDPPLLIPDNPINKENGNPILNENQINI